MRDSRDKIIDQLIDDKNRIYTRLKREEREKRGEKEKKKKIENSSITSYISNVIAKKAHVT